MTGAQFDGKPRSYRDTKSGAMDAAAFLKNRQPHSEVVVKDLQSGALTELAHDFQEMAELRERPTIKAGQQR